jgi:hypothetical protein
MTEVSDRDTGVGRNDAVCCAAPGVIKGGMRFAVPPYAMSSRAGIADRKASPRGRLILILAGLFVSALGMAASIFLSASVEAHAEATKTKGEVSVVEEIPV